MEALEPGWRKGRNAKRSGHTKCPERVPCQTRMCGLESYQG